MRFPPARLSVAGLRPARRDGLAPLRNTINDSEQYRIEEPTVVRVVDGDRHWGLNRAGEIGDVPADVLAQDLRWYAGHVYRTIHRIAARDQALRLAVNDKGRLEVYEGEASIAWVARPDGSWRAALQALEINAELRDADFARPAG